MAVTVSHHERSRPATERCSPRESPHFGRAIRGGIREQLVSTGDGSSIDFLGSTELVDAWFGSSPSVGGETMTRDLATSSISELRQLRGIVIDLLDAIVAQRAVTESEVSALNAYAARASARLELSWSSGQGSAAFIYSGTAADRFLAELAGEAISFLASQRPTSLRRCAGPECFILFVQQHHKRRFCSQSCSHRTRQARYYRSTSNHPATTKATRS